MASGTLKDLSKFLTDFFSNSGCTDALSEDVINELSTFVEKNSGIDQSASQKLHESLLDVYSNHVVGDSEKIGPFVSVLRHLRPAITGDDRLCEWWNLVIRPSVDSVGHKRFVVEDAREFLLKILVFDPDDDKDGVNAKASKLFTQRILDIYLDRTKIPTTPEDAVTPEDEFIAHELESLLVTFGRKMPKELLIAIDELFVRKEKRAQALSLLNSFVRIQPPHLHLIQETPLVHHIYTCLTLDKSTIVVSLALTVFIMILPHITTQLSANLGNLFWIYARLLCWDKYTAEKTKPLADEEEICFIQEDSDSDNELDWDRLNNTFRNVESTPPDVVHFFTFLYGLFPLNFTKFLRKPKKFLDERGYEDPDKNEIDNSIIRTRTEPFQRVHLLHPNFYTTDIEDETAESRWLKSEPADVVTECMGLYVAMSGTLEDPGPPPRSKLPDVPPRARSALGVRENPEPPSPTKLSWRDTQSTTLTQVGSLESSYHSKSSVSRGTSPVSRGRETDSAVTPPVPQHGDPNNNLLKVSSRDPIDEQSRLDEFVHTVSQSPSPSRLGLNRSAVKDISRLQREIMLLKNALNFERYLKSQHLSHIGQLQRKHIGQAAAEADTQGLLNKNRALRAKVAKADELYEQLKKETAMSRNQSKKWEADLSGKLRQFREEKKMWVAERTALENSLKNIRENAGIFSKWFEEAQGNEILLKERASSLQKDLDELSELREEVSSLQSRLRSFELRELDFEQANEELSILRAKLETAKLELTSRDSEIKRMRRAYDAHISELEGQVTRTGGARPISPESPTTGTTGQLPPSMQSIVDSALAANNSKMSRLREQHEKLRQRYFDLETRAVNLELSTPSDHGTMDEFSRRQQQLRMRQAAMGRSGHAVGSAPAAGSERWDVDNPDEFADIGMGPFSMSPPTRFETLRGPGQRGGFGPGSGTSQSGYNEYDLNHSKEHRLSRGQYDNPQAPRSIISEGSGSLNSQGEKKSKVTAKSEVRYYGRGGRQNLGKKAKTNSSDSADASRKSGGLSGMLGGFQKK